MNARYRFAFSRVSLAISIQSEVFHGILHYTAPLSAPAQWTKVGVVVGVPGAVRPYALLEEGKHTLHLWYEQYSAPLYLASRILHRTALVTGAGLVWEPAPSLALQPSLYWEAERVGNPFVMQRRSAEFLLYYSAGSVLLEDSNIREPVGSILAQHLTLLLTAGAAGAGSGRQPGRALDQAAGPAAGGGRRRGGNHRTGQPQGGGNACVVLS